MHFEPYSPDVSSVMLGVSGGLDSTASLIRLKHGGLTLAAAMLLLQTEPFSVPDSDHLCMAEEICGAMDVPLEVINAVKPFKDHVRSYFVAAYRAGLTPCPCALCNQYVKVPLLLGTAQDKGIPYVATGHYASLYKDEADKIYIGRGADSSKDQSYFLSRLDSHQIAHLYFPLAGEEKRHLRAKATARKLAVANREESNDICFLAGRPYADLLRDCAPSAFREGNFIDQDGNVLGKHKGIALYTVGQRKRIGLPGGPWFVKAIHEKTNEIVLIKGERPLTTSFSISDLSLNIGWEHLLTDDGRFEVQTHYRSPAVRARFAREEGSLYISCDKSVLAAPGQICALYDGNVLLGSGIIQKER